METAIRNISGDTLFLQLEPTEGNETGRELIVLPHAEALVTEEELEQPLLKSLTTGIRPKVIPIFG